MCWKLCCRESEEWIGRCEWEWGKSVLVGLELGLGTECKEELKLIDNDGGYFAEVGEVT